MCYTNTNKILDGGIADGNKSAKLKQRVRMHPFICGQKNKPLRLKPPISSVWSLHILIFLIITVVQTAVEPKNRRPETCSHYSLPTEQLQDLSPCYIIKGLFFFFFDWLTTERSKTSRLRVPIIRCQRSAYAKPCSNTECP